MRLKKQKTMTNKHLKTTLIVATVLMSGFGAYRSYSVIEGFNSEKNDLLMDDLEAYTGIFDSLSEYWTRKDWECVEIQCSFHKAEAPKRVSDGKGTEAHSWACKTCETY